MAKTKQKEIVVVPERKDLLFDSNVDIDWAAVAKLVPKGQKYFKVTNYFGSIAANGKGFHMNASGHPRMLLFPETKELILEHDGKFGRAYFAVCNYESLLMADFMLDNPKNNVSFKDRCRHQYRDLVNKKATDKETQGGQGTSFSGTKVDADLEVVHGTEISGPTAKLNPKLAGMKWYSMNFAQFDYKGKIHVVDSLDRNDGKGFQIVNEGDVKAPKQFFNRAQFEEWSEFWLRLNAPKGGRVVFKNIKLYEL